jgi:amidohydrolase
MHACGHDVHAAVAVGIALAWSRLGSPGGIRVIFQPAEERMPGGAGVLVSEGVLDGLESIIAFHVNPTLEPGTIGIRAGPVTASADGFSIVLEGPGGHTSRPERTVDLVSVAAELVLALPSEIRRAVDPAIPVVTAFGSVHGGDAPNVIPTTVTLRGTVRTGDRDLWGEMGELVDRAVARHVSGTGASYSLKYTQGVAPVMNDPGVVATVARGITKYLGEEAVVPVEMSMGGEDFFEYLDHVPGALLRLGTGSGSGDIHSATFVADDRAVPIGVTAGVAALIELLGGRDV